MIQINAAVSICVISLANADLAKNVTNNYSRKSLFVKFLLVNMNFIWFVANDKKRIQFKFD